MTRKNYRSIRSNYCAYRYALGECCTHQNTPRKHTLIKIGLVDKTAKDCHDVGGPETTIFLIAYIPSPYGFQSRLLPTYSQFRLLQQEQLMISGAIDAWPAKLMISGEIYDLRKKTKVLGS